MRGYQHTKALEGSSVICDGERALCNSRNVWQREWCGVNSHPEYAQANCPPIMLRESTMYRLNTSNQAALSPASDV